MTPPKQPTNKAGQKQPPVQAQYEAPPSHVIDSKSDVPWIIKIRDIILTILLWAMYIYFMRDFFDFVVDVYHWAMDGFQNGSNYESFAIFDSMEIYMVVIAIMCLFFIGWALYNLLRFRRRNRRRAAPPVSAEELAQHYGFPAEKVESWQQAQIMVMHHDKAGLLTNVTVQ